MATSYTSLLGLALPVQGELSGTWGDVVNNSITSLVDSAVAGTTTLSTDADVTLTTTTGAANTAREAILLCTGARTVLRNITAPAQSKTYTVINATTGGFAVVIRGVGPTTGISVPAGFSAKVAWNGSDFVQMSVPVANISGLGTGVATALAVNVGTAGSPVVNGGALGTPSSGTVTNLTGTASININGTVGATTPNAGTFTSQNDGQLAGLRNRIINGAMTIDQRNAGASVANPAAITTYTLDRWNIYGTLASKFTCQQASASPPSGFANYMAFTSSAATVAAATDLYIFATRVEGFNAADFAWGTASAKSVTLSFRVYSSLTGTFGGSIGNGAANRCYVFSYSIPVANTWTTISVTIPGDTSGTWFVNNGIGAQMYFDLGSGTSQKTTAGTWGGTFYYGVTGGVNVVATNAATFYITGVQLELGSTATPFEQRPYGMELALCQRYYYRSFPAANSKPLTQTGWLQSASVFVAVNKFPVTMRTSPTTLEQSGTANQYAIANLSTSTVCNAVPAFTNATVETAITSFSTASTLVAGQGGAGYTDSTNGAGAYLGWSAEL